MAEFPAQFRGGKGILLSLEQHEQELFHLVSVNQLPVVVGAEELVQIKGRVYRLVLVLQHNAPAEGVVDHRGELIGIHEQLGQILIGIVCFFLPAGLCVLFVRIGPVENLPVCKLVSRKLLEGRAGEIEGMGTKNVVECLLRLIGLHALLCFIYHQQVKSKSLLPLSVFVNILLRQPAQLSVLSAEIDRALQVLQGHKGNHALVKAALNVLLTGQNAAFAPQSVGIADKAEVMLPADKPIEVLRPGVGYAGTVGNDQNLLKAHADDQIIGAQGLSKAWLCVPQKLLAASGEIIRCHGNCLFLFLTEGIAQPGFLRRRTAGGKLIKILPRLTPVHLKPLGFRLALYMGDSAEIAVELMVGKGQTAAVLIDGIVPPEDFIGDVRGMVLLSHPLLYGLLFRIADLRPALMGRITRMRIGVDHGDNGLKRADIGYAHFSSSPLHGIR